MDVLKGIKVEGIEVNLYLNKPFLDRSDHIKQLIRILLKLEGISRKAEKAFVIVSTNLSGMGKTMFGRVALWEMQKLAKSNEEFKDIVKESNAEDSIEWLRSAIINGLNIFIDFNEGDSADIWQRDFDAKDPASWIGLRLAARGCLHITTAKLLDYLLKSGTDVLELFKPRQILQSIIRQHRETNSLSATEPVLLFIHIDEHQILQEKVRKNCGLINNFAVEYANRFLKDIIGPLVQSVKDFRKSETLISLLMTGTNIDNHLFIPTQFYSESLSLSLLTPYSVFEALKNKFTNTHVLKQPLFNCLLYDLGVIPFFFKCLKSTLKIDPDIKDPSTLAGSVILCTKGRYNSSFLEDISEKSIIMLIHSALFRKSIRVENRIDGKEGNLSWNLRTILQYGFIPYEYKDNDANSNKVKIFLPTILLYFWSKVIGDKDLKILCQVPMPNTGVKFEKIVALTIAVRMKFHFNSGYQYAKLNEIIAGATIWKPRTTKKGARTSITKSYLQQIYEREIHLQPLTVVECKNHCNLAVTKNIKVTELHSQEIYSEETMKEYTLFLHVSNDFGIDAHVVFTSRSEEDKPILCLLQVKASDNPGTSKTPLYKFKSALEAFQNIKEKLKEQFDVLLIIISQQIVPDSLKEDINMPLSGILVIYKMEELTAFSLPLLQHRLTLRSIS